jgi:bifunctional non-homologous end joining protein LigD
VFFAFDLLYFDGHDLSGTELSVRRRLLVGFLDGPTGAIQSSEEVFGDGALLEKACSMGLEGIIAKHRDRPYRSGRTGDWLKIKCLQSESFMIVGYEQSLTAEGLAACFSPVAKGMTGFTSAPSEPGLIRRMPSICARRSTG